MTRWSKPKHSLTNSHVSVNDHGSHDPGDEHKTSYSWDNGARGRANRSSSSITQQKEVWVWRSQTRSTSDRKNVSVCGLHGVNLEQHSSWWRKQWQWLLRRCRARRAQAWDRRWGDERRKCHCSGEGCLQSANDPAVDELGHQRNTASRGNRRRRRGWEKEQCQPQAGSIKKNRKSMANCRPQDQSKAIGTVWHKKPEQQRFKKNEKVRSEAQKVKAGDEVSGPWEVERLEVSRARNDKQAAAQDEQCDDEERQDWCSGCHQVVQHQQREVHVSPGSQSVMRRWEYKSINDECTTSLNWVTSSRTQCDALGADYVKTRSSCLRSWSALPRRWANEWQTRSFRGDD